jgi:hypothetical protein
LAAIKNRLVTEKGDILLYVVDSGQVKTPIKLQSSLLFKPYLVLF